MSTSTPALGETVVEAASIRRRVAELAAAIDAHYVVGYGLDYGQRYRNLADVHALHGV